MPPDQHRSTQCDDVSCFGGWEDVQWAKDGKTLAFASTSRDHRDTWLRVADTATGAVREVFDEQVKTWFESGINAINWRYLPESNEVLWWSQRSNWGHLYLYDLASGKLKRAVTTGDWNVAEILRVDTASRTVWFTGVGHEAGRDPYFQHLYKANLDGGDVTLLSPEDANHAFKLSPDGAHVVDTYSTTDDAAGVGAARCQRRQGAACRSRAPTSRACRPPAGLRRRISRSRPATARPTCTA